MIIIPTILQSAIRSEMLKGICDGDEKQRMEMGEIEPKRRFHEIQSQLCNECERLNITNDNKNNCSTKHRIQRTKQNINCMRNQNFRYNCVLKEREKKTNQTTTATATTKKDIKGIKRIKIEI